MCSLLLVFFRIWNFCVFSNICRFLRMFVYLYPIMQIKVYVFYKIGFYVNVILYSDMFTKFGDCINDLPVSPTLETIAISAFFSS